jgi:hypothetical protein
LRDRIEFAQIELANARKIMIAYEDWIGAELNHFVDTFSWFWTIANGIANVPKGVKLTAIRKNSFERFEVRMDIRDDYDLH